MSSYDMYVRYTPSDLTATPEGVAGAIDTVALCLQPIPDRTAMLCTTHASGTVSYNTVRMITNNMVNHASST